MAGVVIGGQHTGKMFLDKAFVAWQADVDDSCSPGSLLPSALRAAGLGADTNSINGIADNLKGKVVFLWGMESGDKLNFDAQGQEVGSYEKVPFAYSAVKIEGDKNSSTKVEFKGRRVALVFPTSSLPLSTKDLRFIPLKETITISIAVNASDPQTLEGALNQVFAWTAAGALAGRSPEEQQLELNTIGSTTHTDANQPKNLVRASEISKLIQIQNGAKATKLTPLGPSGGVVQLGPQSSANGQTSVPILISSVSPNYPDEARRKGVAGICVLSAIVDTSGYPTHIRVARSIDPELDLEAVIAVSQYRFKPARLRGEVVPVQINVEVNFRNY
jgi:TonB family protein